ncbi:MAG TPA: hypothetical protein VIG30_16805, partial [Ktedonobacterales bacterium]
MGGSVSAGRLGRKSGWRSARRALAGAGMLAGGAVAGAVGAAYYVATALTRPGKATARDEYTFTPFEMGVPYEDVSFPPETGDHVVRGWWL